MPQHIGILAVSAEGAALCYRSICADAIELMGPSMHPEISMHTFPLGQYFPYKENEDWDAVAELLLESAHRLAAAGADFIINPCNTTHQAFDRMIDRSPLPWIHIVDAVAEHARHEGYENLAVIGTLSTSNSTYYPERLQQHDLRAFFPDPDQCRKINHYIYYELLKGECTTAARDYVLQVVNDLEQRGADAVVMGCTEIPLLMDAFDMKLPLAHPGFHTTAGKSGPVARHRLT